MRKKLLVEGVFDGNRECDSVHMIKGWVDIFSRKDQLTGFVSGTFHTEELFDQAVHVEELVQLSFRFEHGHHLKDLFTLLHDRAEQGDGVSHWLGAFITRLHY